MGGTRTGRGRFLTLPHQTTRAGGGDRQRTGGAYGRSVRLTRPLANPTVTSPPTCSSGQDLSELRCSARAENVTVDLLQVAIVGDLVPIDQGGDDSGAAGTVCWSIPAPEWTHASFSLGPARPTGGATCDAAGGRLQRSAHHSAVRFLVAGFLSALARPLRGARRSASIPCVTGNAGTSTSVQSWRSRHHDRAAPETRLSK